MPVSVHSSTATIAKQDRARIDHTGRVSFVLDLDIRMAVEDQAQAQGIGVEEWLQQVANDALRSYIGI